MATTKKNKGFDCLEMKRELQAKIYAEVRDMTFAELRAHMDKVLRGDAFWQRICHGQRM